LRQRAKPGAVGTHNNEEERERNMKRDSFVDFFQVPTHQQGMHKRLENWARAQFSGGGSSASPMFRLYRTPDHWQRQPGIPVDHHDAAKIAKGVADLPEKHRHALQWNYVYGGSPMKARKEIGCTMEGLMSYINDGRQILMNRKV
jgi:DNA-directed RNA polymerase specialized sigma24 family protein